jgi:hypothetical protein
VKSIISGGDHDQFYDVINGDKSLTTKHGYRKMLVDTSGNGIVV